MAILRTVLMVDDEAGFLDVMGRRLRRRGIAAFLADSGPKALELLDKAHVDIVVTDLKMPGMDGITLLDTLQQHYPALPVVLLTGHAGEEDASEAVRRGAASYLHKPCDLDELLTELERVLSAGKAEHRQ